MKRVYHGWIVVEKPEPPHQQSNIFIQAGSDKKFTGMGDAGCECAVAWWDKEVGQKVQLEVTPLGLRVYTEVPNAQG